MEGDELELIAWLREHAPNNVALRTGIGDDMAILAAGGPTLFASDMLLDGVHFDARRHGLRDVGWKAVACNLSDCAAMAVRPVGITISLALPRKFSLSEVQELYAGLFDVAKRFGVAVAGGDTTRWDHPLVIDVAVLAEPYPGVTPIQRSAAQPGDGLYVTGPLGGSILGKHLSFMPRVVEAHRLAASLKGRLHAMIDVSDGLSLDLWRLCSASGVGAVLEEKLLDAVVSEDARRLSAIDGKDPLVHALEDGEDYELLFTAEGPIRVEGVSALPIGRITDSGLCLHRHDGTAIPLSPGGYVH